MFFAMYADLETSSAQLCYKIGYASLTSVGFSANRILYEENKFLLLWPILSNLKYKFHPSGNNRCSPKAKEENQSHQLNISCDKQSLVFLYVWEAMMHSEYILELPYCFGTFPWFQSALQFSICCWYRLTKCNPLVACVFSVPLACSFV